ncbi:hypothetical protein TBR22_A06240 [Luteitalea sp. TBR-22]|uniref:DUF262 domain-containing protein n=1 Tax=Luteitalea sp. TBR-22 TaxID=2802971 RepID=UPI001AF0564B|nr:DUF262 domain-containing protein [Luteitalea sp. TBR-22]BCS31423.1 hypothetical protein TBR22_A06240 [Luteitalea sp. TBR-22]
MKIYDDNSEPLHELLKTASSQTGATLLVPDLQRPYVWSPEQVTLLVDSLLRGWPFGTLLLWKVHKEELAGIPSRPFWSIADRTGEFDDARVKPGNPPAEFRMVLDGQQRLQSLLLAFAGDNWGFRLTDYDWALLLDEERPRGKHARKHWSMGELCLDLHRFREQVQTARGLTGVDFRGALRWVVLSPSHGRSSLPRPATYKYPIPNALVAENRGRFVRLSRLWDIASTQAGLFEQHFRNKLQPLLEGYGVAKDIQSDVVDPLAQLVVTLVGIKQSKVSYLQLQPFDPDVLSLDVYNDAIVNIFTRLNTAGRALTRQEITFAWIKTGWDSSLTENTTAGRCFENLQEALREEKLNLDIDSLVGAVSAMWSVIYGRGALLTASDLLRGDKVGPMARDLVNEWEVLMRNFVDGAGLVESRGLHYGLHYRSLNVLTLLLTWRLLGRKWLLMHPQSVTTADSFERTLDARFNEYADRWLLMSQWSGRWGKSTDKVFGDYVKDLADYCEQLSPVASPEAAMKLLKTCITRWLDALQPDASKYIDDLEVQDRKRVHDYYVPLWLWHRLDERRWKASKGPLRISKTGVSSDVDHLVAVKVWESLPFPESEPLSLAEAPEQRETYSVMMNALGNCCLLEKSFNIAKGASSLTSFLAKVDEFASGALAIDQWTTDLLGSRAALADTSDSNLKAVAEVITLRTSEMKAELKKYISGELQRVDVD